MADGVPSCRDLCDDAFGAGRSGEFGTGGLWDEEFASGGFECDAYVAGVAFAGGGLWGCGKGLFCFEMVVDVRYSYR